jgi:hypothetical protein
MVMLIRMIPEAPASTDIDAGDDEPVIVGVAKMEQAQTV